MTPPADPERYQNHRCPGEIISHGVWLYYRCTLSYRDVAELLCERGVIVSHAAIRQWCRKFGQDYANRLQCRCAQPGDKWYLDEVFLTINGRRHYLWRAVDQDDTAQRFLSAYGPIAPHFRPRRHRLSASAYRKEMRNCFELNNVTRPQRRAKPAGQWDVAGEGGRGSTTAWCLNLQCRALGGVR
jgi:hypothetical protein